MGLGKGFVFSVLGEGGYIHSLEKSRGPGIDPVRIVDRFYLGEPQFRGFDIRGVGPRVLRIPYVIGADGSQSKQTDRDQIVDDSLGGRAYYLARAELELPLGSGAREMGLRPSIYVQAGSLWGITRPLPSLNFPQAKDANGNPLFNKDGSPTLAPVAATDGQGRPIYVVPTSTTDPNSGLQTICPTGYAPLGSSTACSGSSANTALQNTSYAIEQFYGGTWKPRVSIGIGVNWNSPFGPLRIDLAKALVTQAGDDPKLITFNVGTQF